eukprot:4784598-Pyramimonas_sp.AAC.1
MDDPACVSAFQMALQQLEQRPWGASLNEHCWGLTGGVMQAAAVSFKCELRPARKPHVTQAFQGLIIWRRAIQRAMKKWFGVRPMDTYGRYPPEISLFNFVGRALKGDLSRLDWAFDGPELGKQRGLLLAAAR